MLSIIICSRKENVSDELSINIDKTIGCPYELIIIDNSENKYSIFEAYNLGIEKSKGEFLCFVHDDILFHTQDWGEVVNSIFEWEEKVGLIGIAGAKIKTKMPSAWWDCPEEQKNIYIKQHFKSGKTADWNIGFKVENLEEVVVIDGVFMVLRKDTAIGFDETIGGFHNYDLNISFECKKIGRIIVVTNQILIEHFSKGTINKEWLKSTFKIHKLYRSILPLRVDGTPELKDLEILNAKQFLNQCLLFRERFIALMCWIKLFLLNPFLKFHLSFWKNYLKTIL